MEESLFTPAVFAGSLAHTFEYRTRGVYTTPHVQWTFTTPGTISCPVLVDQSVAYVADDLGSLSAIETGSGTLSWRFQTKSSGITAFCLAGALSYVANDDGLLYELERSTGKPGRVWNLSDEVSDFGPIDAIFLYDDLLFLLSGSDAFRFDPSVGQVSPEDPLSDFGLPGIYRSEDGETVTSFGFSVYHSGETRFSASDLTLYGKLYPKIKAAHPNFPDAELWYVDYNAMEDDPRNRTSQIGGLSYCMTPIMENVLYAFSRSSENPEDPEENEDETSALLAIHPRTGDILWRHFYGYEEETFQIAAASGLVFLRHDYFIEAVDVQTHQPRWNWGSAVKVMHLFVADSLLFVFDQQGQITALDARTGEHRWSWQMEKALLERQVIHPDGKLNQASLSTIADGTLYVVAGNLLSVLS